MDFKTETLDRSSKITLCTGTVIVDQIDELE